MDPTRICPHCGCIYSGDKCPNCSAKEGEMSFQTESDANPISVLDKMEDENESSDESADKSTKTGTDSAASVFEEFEQSSLEQGGEQYDTSPLPLVKRNPLFSETIPPTPVNEESCTKETQEGLLKSNPEFVPSLQAEMPIYSNQSSPTFSQRGNPLDDLPFELLISDDSNVSVEEKDKKGKSIDSSEKQDGSDDPSTEKMVQDANKQNICGTPSKDDRSSSTPSSLLESPEDQNKKCKGQPSYSQDGPSTSDSSGHSRTKSKKSPVKPSLRGSFPCSQCGKIFATKKTLGEHMYLHTNQKPFECKDCGHTFALKRYLKVHTRSHTGERPYICKECGKTYSHRNNLVSHFRTHTGEKPYVCPTCRQAFNYHGSYSRHIRRHTK